MAELGLALALVACADQCVKYGNGLIKLCKAYREAEQGGQELLVTIEYNWMKTEAQINFLKKIEARLPEYYQTMQLHILNLLRAKLDNATVTLQRYLIPSNEWAKSHDEKALSTTMKSLKAMNPTKKFRYALKKHALAEIVEDLEKWQARYDPCWMLIMRMQFPEINEELSKESEKPPSDRSSYIMTVKEMRDAIKLSMQDTASGDAVWLDVNSFNSTDLLSTTTQPTLSTTVRVNDSPDHVMLDAMHCNPDAEVLRTTIDVYNLARILATVDPSTFGLLKCRGIIKGLETLHDKFGSAKELPVFTFVFDIPRGLSNPQSLRSILEKAEGYSLNERFDLARQLTHSILYVHTASFVHKNIRPETIVVFKNDKSNIGAPFLLGFEKFRHKDGQTYSTGDSLWEQNLYRHSSRQGNFPEDTYNMQHDIYSVGVVLLEIGLWTSFVKYDASTSRDGQPPVATIGTAIDPVSLIKETHPRKRAVLIKEILEGLAERELPNRMGQKYTDVVLSCLRCLDSGKGVIRPEFMDQDGLVVGERFVESILGKVQEISF